MNFVGPILIIVKTFTWKVLRRTRMEDKLRIQTLNEMKRKLSEISPTQARPANHRVITFCYKHRNLLEDDDAIAKIESAYELITRRRAATFEDEVVIEQIIRVVTTKTLDIDTN